jgi:hypothetical protein
MTSSEPEIVVIGAGPADAPGSFTEPEYASVGLTEKKARETHDAVTAIVHFNSTMRTIIDGRKFGFCKLIADRETSPKNRFMFVGVVA